MSSHSSYIPSTLQPGSLPNHHQAPHSPPAASSSMHHSLPPATTHDPINHVPLRSAAHPLMGPSHTFPSHHSHPAPSLYQQLHQQRQQQQQQEHAPLARLPLHPSLSAGLQQKPSPHAQSPPLPLPLCRTPRRRRPSRRPPPPLPALRYLLPTLPPPVDTLMRALPGELQWVRASCWWR